MVSFYGSEALQLISEYLGYPTSKPPTKQRFSLSNIKLASRPKKASKVPIKDWFFSLSIENRRNVLSICDSELIHSVIQLYLKKLELGEIYIEFKGYSSFETMFLIRKKKPVQSTLSEAEKDLERSIRLTDTYVYLDSLTLDEFFIEEPDRFWSAMTLISREKAFLVPCKEHKFPNKKSIWECPPWLYSANSLASWVCCAFERSLWEKFFMSQKRREIVEIGCQWGPLVEVWSRLNPNKKREIIGGVATLQREFVGIEETLRRTIVKEFSSWEEGSLLDVDLSDSRANFIFFKTQKSIKLLDGKNNFLNFIGFSSLERAVSPFDVLARKILLSLIHI